MRGDIASTIADFMVIKADPYDERRQAPFWSAILNQWRLTYEASKHASSFSEAARVANIEAIKAIIASEAVP